MTLDSSWELYVLSVAAARLSKSARATYADRWTEAAHQLVESMATEHIELLDEALEREDADTEGFWQADTPARRLLSAFYGRVGTRVGGPDLPPSDPDRPLALPPEVVGLHLLPRYEDCPEGFEYLQEGSECSRCQYLVPYVARLQSQSEPKWVVVAQLTSCPLCGGAVGPRRWPQSAMNSVT